MIWVYRSCMLTDRCSAELLEKITGFFKTSTDYLFFKLLQNKKSFLLVNQQSETHTWLYFSLSLVPLERKKKWSQMSRTFMIRGNSWFSGYICYNNCNLRALLVYRYETVASKETVGHVDFRVTKYDRGAD